MAPLVRSNLELEEFAYTAAHDLREPIRTISAFTALLIQKTQLDGESKEIADLIVDGAARMSTLLDDLLAFATCAEHEPAGPVNLQSAVDQAIQNLAFAIQSSSATVTAIDLPTVQGTEIRLVRLFQNLISNAVKYRGEEAIRIQITAEPRDPGWVVRVADNCVGIAPDDHARIFLPFIRLGESDIPGTGLGLAICRKIVEGLGGTIWVESEVGAGSVFCFTIAAL